MDRRISLAAALSGALLVALPAAAQSDNNGQTLTFKEIDKGSTFKFIDNPPRAKNPRHARPGAGDQFVITTVLTDNAGKHIGHLHVSCSVTKATRKSGSAICYGIFALPQGQLDALALLSNLNSATTTGGIIGGTGSFAGARGSFKSVQTKTGNNDTVTLVG